MTILIITVSDLFKFSNFNHIKNLQFNFFIIHFCRNDFFDYGMEVKFPIFKFCFEYETSNLFERVEKTTLTKL